MVVKLKENRGTPTMKAFILNPMAMAGAILLLVLLHTKPVLAGGCSTPSFSLPNVMSPTTNQIGWGAFAIAVGDFNGNGKQDLAVAAGSYGIWVWAGNGDGTFQSPTNVYGGRANSVVVGDFNGDGKPDLAVTPGIVAGNTISVLLGNGDGTFQPAMNYMVGSAPYALTAGDFVGDGRRDFAIAN